MARQRIYEYQFSPGTAGLGTVKIQGRYNLADILAIFDTTTNTSIYNFSDSGQGGTVSFTAGVTAEFPTAYAGVTTLALDLDTSALSANDQLAVYIESQSLKTEPWAFGEDAIGRERISNPESLIDADFEYGLQATKWQNVSLTQYVPNFFEAAGTDLTLNTNGYVTMLASTNLLTSNVDTSVNAVNQGTPPWIANDYALIISQTQGNTTPFVSSSLTANVNSAAERTFTVASTTGVSALDNLVLVGLPTTGGTTTAVSNITSTATTTVNVTSAAAAGIVAGTYIIVETNTAGTFEVMAVTSVVTNALTVVRQVNQTNGAAASINTGRTVFVVTTMEVVRVDEVTNATTLQLERGWYNTSAANAYVTGSIFQRLSSNIEIVKHTGISTAVNGTQTISRGKFDTTALTAAGAGSPFIRLTGSWYGGSNTTPTVGVNSTDSDLSQDNFVSVTNSASSNSEGTSLVSLGETNNFAYFPRRAASLAAGHPLNQTDTVVRQAFAYTGADLDVVSGVSDGGSPSTITITTTFAHGLVPGTGILVTIGSAGANAPLGEGSFLILSVPTTTTFTYQAKSGGAVSSPVGFTVNLRTNATFQARSFDGGVLMGPGMPTRGAAAVRQTKKYFRYQSGKGILFSSGTMLKPTYDIAVIDSDGDNVNDNISITTDVEHGLNPGAVITIAGVTTTGYNDTGYVVTSITSDVTFVVQAQNPLGGGDSTLVVLGQQPRVSITGWHGASVRAGIFDDQNGLFWEHDGQSLNVVQRTSTGQLAGFVNIGVGSNLVTGDGDCRFQDQVNIGDVVVIRGMSHYVTGIVNNNRMTVTPTFRGITNQTRVKMGLRTENRVRQSDFNIDRMDGTGASGFTVDASKMQMIGLEYSWYGAGYVTWMMRGQDGRFIHAHRITNNNRNNEAYMRSGNLPSRYEAIVETAVSSLNGAITDSDTQIVLQDATDYPAASVTFPVFVMIESEIIKYSGKSGNTLTGCTRAATFVQFAEGASRSYTGGVAAAHADNTGVILISCTCVPQVNHWGSSIIMDGNFDGDEGFSFTYNRQGYGLPGTIGATQTAFLMRLAPSVSNGIVGDLGSRDLINRAQLTLKDLVVNVSAGRYLVTGILNPSNIDSANTVFTGLNNAGGGFQPSFSQFAVAPTFTGDATGGVQPAPLNAVGGFTRSGTKVNFGTFGTVTFSGLALTNVSSSGSAANVSVTLNRAGTVYSTTTTRIDVLNSGTGYAVGDTVKILGNVLGGSTTTNDLSLTVLNIATDIAGGERLFAVPINASGTNQLNLTNIKQIGQSAVPGTGTYPNGPEVLAVTITALTTQTNPQGEIQLSFQESQA